MTAMEQRLQGLPGLYLAANYKGGVSVRDRILCADALSRRILQRQEYSPGMADCMSPPGSLAPVVAAAANSS